MSRKVRQREIKRQRQTDRQTDRQTEAHKRPLLPFCAPTCWTLFTVSPPTHKPGAVSLFPSVDTGTEPRRGRVGWVGGRTLRGRRGTGEMVDIGVGETDRW